MIATLVGILILAFLLALAERVYTLEREKKYLIGELKELGVEVPSEIDTSPPPTPFETDEFLDSQKSLHAQLVEIRRERDQLKAELDAKNSSGETDQNS